MYTAIKTGGHEAYAYKHFVADTISDVENIDISTCCMGSTVKVLNTGKKYYLNSQDEWIEDKTSNGSSSGGGTDYSEEIQKLQEEIQSLKEVNKKQQETIESLEEEIKKLKTPIVTNDTMKLIDGQVNNDTLILSPESIKIEGDTLIIGG